MTTTKNLRCSILAAATLISSCAGIAAPAGAQDAATTTDALNAPVFQQIDQNGVDLVTGQLRVVSPTIEVGVENARTVLGLQWTGQGWVYIEQPTIWRKDGVYTVVYNGASEEFNDRGSNYSQRKPITGSKLSCSIFEPGNHASECQYTNRNGDVVLFRGIVPPGAIYSDHYGYSALAFGNLGMAEATLYSVDNARGTPAGRQRWGVAVQAYLADPNYNKQIYNLVLGPQKIVINTPNHDGTDQDEHYLRPKSTTQTFTDDVGSVWRYTINGDREMTQIQFPGGKASISFGYNSNHKVTSVTTADGTWTYAYTTPGDYGTTTITNPLGEQTYVKYHRDRGYVTEARDALNRWTYYEYDTGYRLTKVTYPEGNFTTFTYDARGNITNELRYAKDQSSYIARSASYPSGCSNQVTCNLPLSLTDAAGAVTDFEYATPGTASIDSFAGPTGFPPVASGTTKPITVTLPAPYPGAPRPRTVNIYQDGVLIRSAQCQTQATCAGTADEVVTEYDYAGSTATARLVRGVAVTAGGQTLRTCYGYDSQARLISETPPAANLSSCPSTGVVANAVNAVLPTARTQTYTPTYPDTP